MLDTPTNPLKIYVLYTKGPKTNPEGKFLAELIKQDTTPGFFVIQVRGSFETLIVERHNLELDWIKQ